MVGDTLMNEAGPYGCADHNHERTFSARRYLRHGESTYVVQVASKLSGSKNPRAW
jgi:hypothetical protein